MSDKRGLCIKIPMSDAIPCPGIFCPILVLEYTNPLKHFALISIVPTRDRIFGFLDHRASGNLLRALKVTGLMRNAVAMRPRTARTA